MAKALLESDYVGVKFGLLTIQAFAGRSVCNKHVLVRVICACGNSTVRRLRQAKSGQIAHCGCRNALQRKTHGLSLTPEYGVWGCMRRRCDVVADPAYPNYGGRGITYEKSWVRVEQFIADMGPRPSPKHSLDRIDNNGDYTPANCRWVTRNVQMRNTRSNIIFNVNGEELIIHDAAIKVGLLPTTLRRRRNLGWTDEEAIQPVGYRRQRG